MSPKPAGTKHTTPADTSEAVDTLMRSLTHPEKALIEALRGIILAVDPSVREGVKWNAPSFRTTEYFATTNLRTKHGIGVVLHFGAKVRSVAAGKETITDPGKVLTWVASDRATVGFADLGDLLARKNDLQAIVRQWITHV